MFWIFIISKIFNTRERKTMNLKDYDIIFVSDYTTNHAHTNLSTGTLEMPEHEYFEEIYNALKEIGKSFNYVKSPKELIKKITTVKKPLILSIWSGKISKNRKCFVPAICESYGVPYFGADAFTNLLCADKIVSKEYAKQFGIKSANYDVVHSLKDLKTSYDLKYPVVVKPVCEGGSIGISSKESIVYNAEDANKLIKKLLKNFTPIMLEEYIQGFEVSVIVFGNKTEILRTGVTQLIINGKKFFTNEIWGYEDKKIDETASIECDGSELKDKIPWQNIQALFHSFDKVELIRFDGRINDDGFFLIELSPDAYIGSEGSVGYLYTKILKMSIKDMLIEFLTNSLNSNLIH
jgi:D-alanine-D-alanine ligase and related ATP-grasp enzymes